MVVCIYWIIADCLGATTASPLPTTYTSPPPTTGTTPTNVCGRDEMRFMPTPGRPTLSVVPPEFVHTKFI